MTEKSDEFSVRTQQVFDQTISCLDQRRSFLAEKMEWARRQIETGAKIKDVAVSEDLIDVGIKWLQDLRKEVDLLDKEISALKPNA